MSRFRRRDSLLLRHGKAGEYRADDPNDDARELTDAGSSELHAAAPLWRRLNLRPDLVISSPLPRAVHRRLRWLRWLTLALLIGLPACVAATPLEPSASQGTAHPSTVGAPIGCSPIDLLDPSGRRIELTGTWRQPSGGPVYYLWQDGDCVWYAGGFAASDGDQSWGPLGKFTVVFEGHARTDFTVVGRWAVVRTGTSLAPYEWRDKTWAITFETMGEENVLVLTAPLDSIGSGLYAATRLVKLSDDVIEP